MDMEILWLLLFPGRTPAPPDMSVRGTHSFRCFKLYCLWERTLNEQFPAAFWQPVWEAAVQSGLCLAQKVPLGRGYVCPVRSSFSNQVTSLSSCTGGCALPLPMFLTCACWKRDSC